MRTGIPLIPILKQQRLSDPSGSKLRSTPRRLAGGDSVSSARNSDISKEDSCEVPSLRDGQPPLGQGVMTAVLRQTRRSEGTTCRRPARNTNHGAGSTGGTGSSGNIAGAGASPLSAFWSHIDDLDHDLHLRAQAAHVKSGPGKRSVASTQKEASLLRTPDSTPKDVIFVQTPEMSPKDVIFPETPELCLKIGNFQASVSEDISMDEGSLTLE